jgi:hypothetical protein
MPAPKRSSSSSSGRSSSSSRSASQRRPSASRSGARAAASGVKATGTSARKASSRTATQAKSGATRTGRAAKSAGASAAGAAKTARSSAKGTTTAARRGAKDVGTTTKRAATRTSRASGASDNVSALAEQIVRGRAKSRDVLMLTRERIQETLDDAAARGRVTRKDANELVAELVRRSRSQSDELLSQIGQLASGGRDQLGSAGRKVRKNEGVDRVVRGADRARRTVGVGPAFPILGYDDLNAPQVKSRIKELDRPELRKVLNYERKHANRKSVVGALEKTLG